MKMKSVAEAECFGISQPDMLKVGAPLAPTHQPFPLHAVSTNEK
jgi:hypothetical protein